MYEPSDKQLWAQVTDAIRLFLRGQWRIGALFGATEDKAFFVKCDETTMTQDDIDNGRLVCEIGIAPVRPAEFVIFGFPSIPPGRTANTGSGEVPLGWANCPPIRYGY